MHFLLDEMWAAGMEARQGSCLGCVVQCCAPMPYRRADVFLIALLSRRYIDSRSGSSAEPAAGSSSGGSCDAAAGNSTCVAVFTAGQVALLRAAKPSSNLTLLLQTLTAHRFLPGAAAVAASQQYGAPSSQVMLSQYHGPEGPAAAAGAAASQALANQQQQQQLAEGPSQQPPAVAAGAEAVGAAGGRPVPACVQAHAWIALGKVCLVDEGLAKKVVPLFVQVSEGGAYSKPLGRRGRGGGSNTAVTVQQS